MARILLAATLGLGLAALHTASAFQVPAPFTSSSSSRRRGTLQMAAGDAPVNPDHDILLRVARGERAHRTPVWLMRQVRCLGWLGRRCCICCIWVYLTYCTGLSTYPSID
jgi:hypothetical protein